MQRVEQERAALAAQLDERARRREASQGLLDLRNELYEIGNATSNEDDDSLIQEREAQFQDWRTKAAQFIYDNITPAKAGYFLSNPPKMAGYTIYSKPISKERSRLLEQMDLRKERLDQLMHDY